MDMSNSDLFMEYARCLGDSIYCIETYLQTFDKTQGGYVPFKLFPKQKELIESYEKNDFVILKKPRQAGITTTTAAWVSHRVGLADDQRPERILLIANKHETSQKFLAQVKEFLGQYPDWMGVTIAKNAVKWNEKHIILKNGSEVKAVATSIDSLRGYSPTIVIFDEAAFIDNGDELWKATFPSLSTGGKCFMISTTNGMDALYFVTYDSSLQGKNDFKIVEVEWWQDPRYNKELEWRKDDKIIKTQDLEKGKEYKRDGYKPWSPWYENMCRQMNWNSKAIAQELDGDFVGSGGNVIDEEYIKIQEVENVCHPVRTENFDNGMWIWKDAENGKRYVISCDVSSSFGTDYSTMEIIDVEKGEQVAEYQGKIRPDIFAEVVYHYWKIYSGIIVVDVTGGMGLTVILKLFELGLDKKYMYYDIPKAKMINDKFSHLKTSDDKMPGFQIQSNRPLIIDEFERQVRMNEFKIRSSRLCSEMKTFVYDRNGKPNHTKNTHDDLIMGCAMGLYVIQTSLRFIERNMNHSKAILNAMINVNDKMNNNREMDYQTEVSKQYTDNMWLFR
jgi:hypothetical protein